jgi:hypothetical protein
MYLEMDLTGQNELYAIDNHVFLIVANNMKLSLKGTVHVDSIKVTLMGTINQNMPKDIDWTVQEDDMDYEAMGAARLRDPDFTGKLCKSITIVKPYVADYKLSLKYQRLYPVHGKLAFFNEEPLEFDPSMLAWMLRSLDYLMNIIGPVKDVQGPNYQNPWGLEPDPYLKRPENFIQDEIHQVNVPNGVTFIHPIGGSFHKDTLTIIDLNTGNTLHSDVDYKAYGMHPHKTRLSSHTGGVYEFILFLKPYVGNVRINYHAYGGSVTISDHRILLENLNNIMTFIGQSQFVTYENLKDAPIMAKVYSLYQQLQTEVKQMRSLLSGRPSGADSSHGSVMKKRIMANDTNLHWWNIATLYKVEGSPDIVTADVLKIRVRTNYTVFMFDAIVAFNQNAPDKKLDVTVLSPVYPKGYVPYQDYTGLNNIIRPQFRCIWNVNTVEGSGITLQMGMPLKTVSEEILVVENWSGPESCWMLEPSPVDGQYGQDNVIKLPAGNHYWDTNNPDSRFESTLLPFDDGHIVWAGSAQLNAATGMQYLKLNHLLEKEIDITKIKRISLDLSEHPEGQYRVYISFVPGSEKLMGSTSILYNGKVAYLNGTLRRAVTGDLSLEVTADITAGPASNPLFLRHVHVYTN